MQPFAVDGQRRYSVLWSEGQHGQPWTIDRDGRQVVANADDTWSWARRRQLLVPPG